jgi:tetratricopeptide (TPR) repeat protein
MGPVVSIAMRVNDGVDRARQSGYPQAMNSSRASGKSSSGRTWLGPLVIGAIALILRLVHLHQIQHNPFFHHPIVDAWDYHKDALRMVQTGDWIGGRAFFQAPLTTYFLAIIYRLGGVNLIWPRVVQVVLGTLTAAGAAVLGRRLFNERAAWIAGLGVAAYPLFIFFEGELLAPTITVFLDLVMFAVLFLAVLPRPGWLWLTPGLIFGLRALATTNNLATLPVFWIWTFLIGRQAHWSRRRTVLATLAFTIGAAVVISPVTIRNWVLHRQFVLVSSNAGINFYLGNSGDYDARIAIRPGADWDEFVGRHAQTGLKAGPEMSGYFFDKAWEYIREHPGAYARLLLWKSHLFLKGDEIMRNQEIYPFRNHSAVLRLLLWKIGPTGGMGLAVPFGLLLPLAWPGVLLALRKRNMPTLLLLGFAVAYGLSVIAFFVTARYRVPVVLPLLLLAAYGWSLVRQWWDAGRWLAVTLAGMVGLAVVANWGVGPMPKETSPDAYYSLANTLAEQGDLAGAQRYYKKTLELNSGDAAAWNNLGLQVHEARGDLDRAEYCYHRAISIRPGYAAAVYNLAHLADMRGHIALAESLYFRAAELDPLMAAPYINLGYMALVRKDYANARELYQTAYQRDPESPKALMGLGITSFEILGLESALEYFSLAQDLDPGSADLHYNLAMVYARSGKPVLAAGAARRVIELTPEDEQAYTIYADQMRLAGRINEAAEFLSVLAGRRPDLVGPRRALELLRE